MRLELSLVNLTHKKRKESASPVSQVIQITLIQLILLSESGFRKVENPQKKEKLPEQFLCEICKFSFAFWFLPFSQAGAPLRRRYNMSTVIVFSL